MGLEDAGGPETAEDAQDADPVCEATCGKCDCCS